MSLIEIPTIIAAAGNSPKRITEHVERDGWTRLLRRPRTTRYATRRRRVARSISRSVASLLATGGRQGPLHNNSLEGPLPEGNLCPQRLPAINARAITKLPSGRQSGNYPETALAHESMIVSGLPTT